MAKEPISQIHKALKEKIINKFLFFASSRLHGKSFLIKSITTVWVIILGWMLFTCITCSNGPLIAGGGTEGGNVSTVTGRIIDATGSGASNVQVQLIPATYNPVFDQPIPDSLTDITGADGSYRIKAVPIGEHTLQAQNLDNGERLLHRGIIVDTFDITLPVLTLWKPGTIRVLFTDSRIDTVSGYVYIPGTDLYSFISHKDYVIIDSVPADTIPELNYAIKDDAESQRIICKNIKVSAGDTISLTYTGWSYAQNIFLNTTVTGANIQGTVYDFPVLVRLTHNNFSFKDAKKNGEDLRFEKPDRNPLPFEVERWDSANVCAEVWVTMDTIYGNDSTHYFIMRWGNPDAVSASNGAEVFDTANNFLGVWHMGDDPGGDAPESVKDATAYGAHGTPIGAMTTASRITGIIGNAIDFDGHDDKIDVPVTGVSKLHDKITVSLWAFGGDRLPGDSSAAFSLANTTSDTIDGRLILAHIPWFNQWIVFDAPNKLRYIPPFDRITKACDAQFYKGTWTFWAFTKDTVNGYMRTYMNGMEWHSDTGKTLSFYGVQKFIIGADYLTLFGNFCYHGTIDEFVVSDVERSPDWIKLCFMNQNAIDALLVFK